MTYLASDKKVLTKSVKISQTHSKVVLLYQNRLFPAKLTGCWPSGRAFASEPVDPEFDSGSGHTKHFRKLVFTASCLALSIKDSVKTKPAS